MKTFQLALHTLFLVAWISPLSLKTLAQDQKPLPPELSQSSSLSEIIEWLDKVSFPQARVGVNRSGDSAVYDIHGYQQESGTLAERFVFSPGFRLANLVGCNLTLKNDNVKLLRYADNALFAIGGRGIHRFSDVGKAQTSYVAELSVPLDRMSDRKGKATYRHTSDPKQAGLLGMWRTTFETKKNRRHVGISVFPVGQTEKREYTNGEMLTFTFDSKDVSDKFNGAFRRAIKLCGEK